MQCEHSWSEKNVLLTVAFNIHVGYLVYMNDAYMFVKNNMYSIVNSIICWTGIDVCLIESAHKKLQVFVLFFKLCSSLKQSIYTISSVLTFLPDDKQL